MKHLKLLFAAVLVAHFCSAQPEISIIATDLRGPVGIEHDINGNLWVAEIGTGQGDGAVSVIWADGSVQRIIDSLPSVISPMGETFGPVRAQPINGEYLGVFTGEAPGETQSSILVYTMDSLTQIDTPLRAADASHVINIGEFVIERRGLEGSDPYTLVHDGCDMYIADAAANALLHRDGLTGALNIFATFPDQPNPLPFGPPFYQAVPTRVLPNPEGGFLVSQLTGFPFLDGAANIFRVSDEGDITVLHDNLTLVTDMAHSPDGDGLYVLQFARFNLDSVPPFLLNSAVLLHVHEDDTRDTLLSGFGPSPGLTLDEEGNCYVTQLFFGVVMKIEGHSTSGIQDLTGTSSSHMLAYPNPVREVLYADFQVEQSGDAAVKVFDMIGNQLYSEDLGMLRQGLHHYSLETRDWKSAGGMQQYLLSIQVAGKEYRQLINATLD